MPFTRLLPALLLTAAVTSCEGTQIERIRTEVWNLFPFDGDREWLFVNAEDGVDHRLVASIVGDPDQIGERNVYAVTYRKDCNFADDEDCTDNEEVLNIRWSSDPIDGVLIHGYSANDVTVRFQPPVVLTPERALTNEPITTVSDGITWTSTFTGLTTCPVRTTNEWQCGVFTLTSEGDTVFPIEGTYWAVGAQGVVGLDLDGDDVGAWELADNSCSGDCNGEW